jgi:probable rRNA maturation factor
MSELRLLNRQRSQPIDLHLLRRVTESLFADLPEVNNFDVVIHLVNDLEMTRLNETQLRHAGSTDVITFDYSGAEPLPPLAGEIFVCVDEAMRQAARFRTTWQNELARYIVHGLLHLRGYDDVKTAARHRMKLEEGQQVRKLARDFDLRKLRRKPRVNA